MMILLSFGRKAKDFTAEAQRAQRFAENFLFRRGPA
jgi:hypothetical protein